MNEPIIFISHFTVKEGRLDELKALFGEVLRMLEGEKPRTTAQLAYVNDTGTRLTVVHVFSGPDAMDLHFQGADERSQAAYQFMDPAGWEIYGTPSDTALQMMQQAATSAAVALEVEPDYLGGFLRSPE